MSSLPTAFDMHQDASTSSSATVDNNDSPVGHANTRSEAQKERVQTACTYCRYRKVKCDGGKPSCSFCTHMGREQQCVYAKVSEEENQHLRRRKRELRARRAAERLRAQQEQQQQQSSPNLEGRQWLDQHRLSGSALSATLASASSSSPGTQRRRRASVPKRTRSSIDVGAQPIPFSSSTSSSSSSSSFQRPSMHHQASSSHAAQLSGLPLELSNTISPSLLAFLAQPAPEASSITSPSFTNHRSSSATPSSLSSSFPHGAFDDPTGVSSMLEGWTQAPFRNTSDAANSSLGTWGSSSFALPASALSASLSSESTSAGDVKRSDDTEDALVHEGTSASSTDLMQNFVTSFNDAALINRANFSTSSDGDNVPAPAIGSLGESSSADVDGLDEQFSHDPWTTTSTMMTSSHFAGHPRGASPSSVSRSEQLNEGGAVRPASIFSLVPTMHDLRPPQQDKAFTVQARTTSAHVKEAMGTLQNASNPLFGNLDDVYQPTPSDRVIFRHWPTRADSADQASTDNNGAEERRTASVDVDASSARHAAMMTSSSSSTSSSTAAAAPDGGNQASIEHLAPSMPELRRFFHSNGNPFNYQPVMPLAMSISSPSPLAPNFAGSPFLESSATSLEENTTQQQRRHSHYASSSLSH